MTFERHYSPKYWDVGFMLATPWLLTAMVINLKGPEFGMTVGHWNLILLLGPYTLEWS